MADGYTGYILNHNDERQFWSLSNSYIVCNENEEYLTLPRALGQFIEESITAGDKRTNEISGVTIRWPGTRCAGYIFEYSDGQSNISLTNAIDNYGTFIGSYANSSEFPSRTWSQSYLEKATGNVETNIPIFGTWAEATAYVRAATDELAKELITHALNYKEDPEYEPDTKYYHIYNEVGSGDQVRNTVTQTPDTTRGWRSLVFQANEVPVAFYASDSYELVLMLEDVVASYYLTAPGPVIRMVPENDWHDGLVNYQTFYGNLQNRMNATHTNLPDGTYDYGFSLDTNIYIFANYEDAVEAKTNKDYRKATNYNQISNGNTKLTPDFADEEQETVFGPGADTSPFTQSYVMTRNNVLGVALKFYDSDPDVVKAMLDGMTQFGANPANALAGLTLYPFDVNDIVNTVPQSHIYFGSYQMQLGFSVNKVLSMVNNAYLDCGTIFLRELYGNYMDYEPYTTVSVYLPFIGWQKLDIRPLINRNVNIRYYVDIHTRACVAVILADYGQGMVMVKYFTGTIGVCLPVTAADFQSYSNAALTSILSTAGGVVSGAGTALGAAGAIAAGGAGALSAGVVAAGGIAAAGLSLAGGLFDMEKLGKPKDHAMTHGNYTSGIGCYMPNYIIWRYDMHEPIEPDNLAEIYGKPSSASGKVSYFSGFLKVRSAKLNTTGMTNQEANEIAGLLKSGIYI